MFEGRFGSRNRFRTARHLGLQDFILPWACGLWWFPCFPKTVKGSGQNTAEENRPHLPLTDSFERAVGTRSMPRQQKTALGSKTLYQAPSDGPALWPGKPLPCGELTLQYPTPTINARKASQREVPDWRPLGMQARQFRHFEPRGSDKCPVPHYGRDVTTWCSLKQRDELTPGGAP